MDRSIKGSGQYATAFIAGAALLGLGLAVQAADRGQGVELRKTAISSGGTVTSSGGGFTLGGTIGQPGAAGTRMTGDDYALRAGFWPAGSQGNRVFTDGFETGDLSRWSP